MTPNVSSHWMPKTTLTPSIGTYKSFLIVTSWMINDTCLQTSLHTRYSPLPINTLNSCKTCNPIFNLCATESCVKLWVNPLSMSTVSSRPHTVPFNLKVRGLKVPASACKLISVVPSNCQRFLDRVTLHKHLSNTLDPCPSGIIFLYNGDPEYRLHRNWSISPWLFELASPTPLAFSWWWALVWMFP